MSRLKQAQYMALTDPFWAGYIAGLDDKHNVRVNDDTAHHAEVNRLLQARLDRHEAEERRRASREPWDNDWAPVTHVPNSADLGGPRVP